MPKLVEDPPIPVEEKTTLVTWRVSINLPISLVSAIATGFGV